MSSNTKNYAAHGGNEWVVGGKLILLPGATVEGGEGLLSSAFAAMHNQPDSTATTVAGLRDDLNALLAKLKASGAMAADEPVQ